jgi:hypothetical protein
LRNPNSIDWFTLDQLNNLFTEETVVQVGDRVNVYSASRDRYLSAKVVKEPNPNGFWGIIYEEDGQFAMKLLHDSDLIVEAPPVLDEFVKEEIVKSAYEVVFPDGHNNPIEFESITDAGLFASGVKHAGVNVEIYAISEKIVRERKLVDSL